MIAGYIGKEPAAQVLSEMQRRQEPIFGGFSSGIATCVEGRLYRERAVGSFDILNDPIEEGSLPGTIGIAHSRTNSGGGVSWAQPRLDLRQSIATVGNGILGVLSNPQKIGEIAEKLLKANLRFQTSTDSPVLNAVALSNGAYIHPAEVLLEAVSLELSETVSFEQAIRAINMRSESVEIYLAADHEQALYVVNHNQRLVAAKTAVGMHLATSRLAFGHSADWEVEIPPNSIAVVHEDEVHVKPLWIDERRYDFTVAKKLRETFLSYIASNPGSFWEDVVNNSLYPTFSKDSASLVATLGHRLFEECLSQGEIKTRIDRVIGLEGQIAPKFRLYKVHEAHTW